MKKNLLTAILLLSTIALTAQINIISTSFYSQALDETKMVNVFLPPGYDANPDLHYPVIYFLHGWQGNQNSGNPEMNTAYTMINQGLIEPVIIVCAHNSPAPFGGSVYTNSILWGDYETYMTEDLCNWVESTYRAMPGKEYRAVFGMSMGGYGAFRYGILHNDKYCALAACAAPVSFLEDNMRTQFRQMILQANQPGPPYTYNFATGGPFTQIYFLYYGAFVPNYNTPQTYINPAILEFPLDENGNYIDTILAKVIPHDIASLINQLTPESSPGIYFGCGTNDPFFLYPGNMDVKDSLDLYSIPYTFYSHGGGHTMPAEFTENAFMFLDSLLMPPIIPCSCLPQGITFLTQAQIDNFQTNYPGCTEIEGDVIIWGSNISNLNGLSVLSTIGGYLEIKLTGALNNFMVLNNLNSIGGHLEILWNDSLTSLEGLESLTSIGGYLFIDGNSSLSVCDAGWLCDFLAVPTGSVSITNNAPGCNSIIEVANACGGIPCLPYGNYYFRSQSDIYNFQAAFPNCTELQGHVWVAGNNIANLSGLDIVTSIGGGLSIGSTNSLTNLTGLESLTSIGDHLYIANNNALTSLTALENLATIGGSLTIGSNSSLSSCDSDWLCDYLVAPNGAINISGNAVGCNSVVEVAAECGGLPCLPYGNYYFLFQSDIDNFKSAFTNCTELQGYVSVFGNDIINLSGLDIVTSIGGGLFIGSTSSMTNLIGLENLTSLGGLWLEDNESLTNLTGLHNIAASSITYLWIFDNELLSTCEVQGICDYLVVPNGEVIIENNAPGCNSPEEVIAACEATGLEETITESDFFISPNPFTGQLTIEFNLPQTSTVSIQIFNAMGAKVAELHHGQLPAGQQQFRWDAGDLPKGLYFCRVQAGNETRMQKIVKN